MECEMHRGDIGKPPRLLVERAAIYRCHGCSLIAIEPHTAYVSTRIVTQGPQLVLGVALPFDRAHVAGDATIA